ncbi:helix-turn-helix transcriptional regulator [Parolsenella catena]|uniref:helix-turn-helix domain-containing protein n=1 Tax=Parolsenella catena TaxID=2003188 RepID=UPI00319E139C
MTFGQKVRYVRKKLDYTQTEFAKVLSVSFATVNRWENGRVAPSVLAAKAFYEFCEDSFISFPSEE